MKKLQIEQMEVVSGGGPMCDAVMGGLIASGAGILTPWGPVCIVTCATGLLVKAFHGCGY
jgi:hypothetical protein